MTTEEFDAAVAALRGKVTPKAANKKKANCTPAEWAANLDYGVSANKRNRDKNPERKREVRRNSARKKYAENPDRFKTIVKEWASKNPESVREGSKRWRENNLEAKREANKKWAAANRDKVREATRKYEARRLREDEDFRMRRYLRTRQRQALAGIPKVCSAVRDLGCTIEELWVHLESKFQPGMTRENYGPVWVLDHIFPLAKVKKGCRIEFLASANWRNLQPLTPEQNNEKGDTVTPEAQALFDRLVKEFSA